MEEKKKISRRDALKAMMFAGAGLALGSSAAAKGLGLTRPLSAEEFKFIEPSSSDKVIAREWPGLGEKIGLLGLGCMRLPVAPGQTGKEKMLDQVSVNMMIDYALAHGINYFDTAPAYGDSERAVGEALSRHPRKSYLIATKMSNYAFGGQTPTLEGAQEMFARSLERLHTDYVDFFLLHSVGNEEALNSRFLDNGVVDWLFEMKMAGKIRHLGFSTHGTNDFMERLINLPYKWDFAQIQMNYVDWKNMPLGRRSNDPEAKADSETLYNLLTAKGIPVAVMEPIRGGALANVPTGLRTKMEQRHPELSPAGMALTFAASFPNVMVTLSGMSNMQQLMENIYTFSHFKPFDEKDNEFMMEMAELYKANPHIPCTGCRYCMPCPRGVDIPGIFAVYNAMSDELNLPDPKGPRDAEYERKRKLFLERYATIARGADASVCVNCGACLKKCPQRIQIPDYIKRIESFVQELNQ